MSAKRKSYYKKYMYLYNRNMNEKKFVLLPTAKIQTLKLQKQYNYEHRNF